MSARPTVLALIGAFWPGNDSSGPNLSLKAMCEGLAGEVDFRLVARDRPFGANAAAIGPGWHDLGYAQACYLPVGRAGAVGLNRLIAQTPHDVLHLNGFNDREFTLPALVARRLLRRPAPALLSPRGEFSAGARAIKPMQKRLWLAAARAGGLLNGVTFHATSEAERDDMAAALPGADIALVPNFRPIFPLPAHAPRAAGTPLRIAFLGRISPVKGVDIALRLLAGVTHRVRFEIYGPVQDAAYWRECQALIAALPPHIAVAAMGEIANSAVAQTMARQDLMLLPSLSENFGHGIFEALASGTPVLIGDKTPWRGLSERQAGFDLPLSDLPALTQVVDRMAAMDPATAQQWRDGARRVAVDFVAASPARLEMQHLYHALAGK